MVQVLMAGCLICAFLMYGHPGISGALAEVTLEDPVPAHGLQYDEQGRVQMGVPSNECDNGVDGIAIDWDPASTAEYTCDIDSVSFNFQREIGSQMGPAFLQDRNEARQEHICLDQPIHYENIPLSGSHRPLWPKYGEYVYLPPQRWVHSLEHGAIVLLYHPCISDQDPDLQLFKSAVQRCLRKHVITPSKLVTAARPFAVLAQHYGLLLNGYDEDRIVKFIRTHALNAKERRVWQDGQYYVGMVHKAPVVSDIRDSKLCPNFPQK